MILPDNQYMETKYDIRGRIIEEIDQTGSSTKYAYDNADHLISVTDSNGSTWTYDYDVQGNITCVTDPQGNKTSYTFDKMNRLVKTTLPMGMTATNTYDEYGYKTAYTDYNGDTTRYVYDEYYDLDKVIYYEKRRNNRLRRGFFKRHVPCPAVFGYGFFGGGCISGMRNGQNVIYICHTQEDSF